MTNAQSKMINEKFQFPKVMLFTETTKTELRGTEEMSAFVDMTENTYAFNGNFEDNGEETGEELRIDKEFFAEIKDSLITNVREMVSIMTNSDSIQNYPLSPRSKEELQKHSMMMGVEKEAGLNKDDVNIGFLRLLEQMVKKMRGEEKPNDWGLGGKVNEELQFLRVSGRELCVCVARSKKEEEEEFVIILSIFTPKEYKRVFGDSQTRYCENCEKQGKGGVEKMEKCGGCNSVRYCSLECQKEHWKSHKTDCKKLQPIYKTFKEIKEIKAKIDDEC